MALYTLLLQLPIDAMFLSRRRKIIHLALILCVFVLIFHWLLKSSFSSSSTAALIVGGFRKRTALRTVEVFGCPQNESFYVEEHPFESVYLTNGHLRDNDRRVFMCGGFACLENGVCEEKDVCFTWTPAVKQWKEEREQTLDYHTNHLVVKVDEERSLILEEGKSAEIQTTSGEWTKVDVLGENLDFASTDCVAQLGHYLYRMSSTLSILNLKTWEWRDLGGLPDFVRLPHRCALTRVRNRLGK